MVSWTLRDGWGRNDDNCRVFKLNCRGASGGVRFLGIICSLGVVGVLAGRTIGPLGLPRLLIASGVVEPRVPDGEVVFVGIESLSYS